MQKINTASMPESAETSPGGKFSRTNKDISIALGRKPESTDLRERHPFDVQICRIPAGKSRCPYHSHSAQWEFFHVIAGTGSVRHNDGVTPLQAGDAFIFRPGEPHQLISGSSDDLVLYIVADNPLGETCYYPDSKKWEVSSPSVQLIRSAPIDYFDGEE